MPMVLKLLEGEQNFKNLLNSAEFTMDELFLSDSEAEEHIEVPKQQVLKTKENKKKTRASPVILFQVLISPNNDTNISSDESDKEDDEGVNINEEK
jgi:hypothetical protein